MVQNEKDNKIEKISKLLEQGGTMLAQHCKCGAPLFRYHGNVICPICDSHLNEIKNKNENMDENKIENKIKKEIERKNVILNRPSDQSLTSQSFSTSQSSPTSITPETQEFISNAIINKITQLCSDLDCETDLNRVKKQLETIGSGIKVLNEILEKNPR
ncbi:MAG: Sjogren's syndrome/scleroderma autoantigen 1 family protein [Euryarchaeota archaeon]|nr:Sjogren's syndrome/scleroderma autoantigen 1 family protein [Euryarchaeota archaeon]